MSEQSVREAVDEIWKLFKETDARLDQRFLETDSKFKETEARFRETEARFRETDQHLRTLEGLFTGQWGKMLEALVTPGALSLFQGWGIDVHRSYQRSESQLDGQIMEIDLLLENGSDVVVVEVKSTLKVADVQEFLADLDQFIGFFPHHRGKTIYGAVAGLTIEESADRYAYRHGLFVLSVSGDGLVRILNGDRFSPTNFGATRA